MSDPSPASSISGSPVAPVETPQEGRRPGLLARLLVSYVLVVAAGIGTLVVVARLVAAPTFDASIGRVVTGVGMMRGGPGGMDAQMVSFVRASFTDALGLALPVAAAVAAIVAVIAGVALSRWLTAPIRRMVAVSRRIAEGRYDERVVPGQGGEIEELAASFNAMAASLEATEQRRIELVGDVAHELRTPLSSLEGYLEGLQDGVVAPTPGTWALLLSHTARLSGLVDDLQELWRADAGQVAFRPELVDCADILAEAITRLAGPARARSVALLVDTDTTSTPAWADRSRLSQVLDNLVGNALRYVPEGSAVTLAAETRGRDVVLSVRDQGPGLTADQLDRVFERFYRIDPSRSRALGGSGIGLAIARALIDGMGGRLWAESAGPGRGSTFRIALPASA